MEGHYHSSTTSTTDYGVTIRIDLSHPEDTYTKLAACVMLEPLSDVSDSLILEERSGVQIKGTIADAFIDQSKLEGCTLLNR